MRERAASENILQKGDHQLVMPGKKHKRLKLLTAQVLLSSEKENFLLRSSSELGS